MMSTRGFRWGRLLTLFLSFWLCCLVYFLVNLMSKNHEAESGLASQLEASKIQVETLRRENFELRDLLKTMQARLTEREEAKVGINDNDVLAPPARVQPPPAAAEEQPLGLAKYVDGPTLAYEQTRRLIQRDLNGFANGDPRPCGAYNPIFVWAIGISRSCVARYRRGNNLPRRSVNIPVRTSPCRVG